MESEGVTATVTVTVTATSTDTASAAAAPSSPPQDPDFSAVGSPDSHLQEVPQPSDDHPSSQTLVLTDDLRDKIIKQVEYYFSDENLPTDNFLMKYVTKDKEGFVPVAVICSFRKMKKISLDRSLMVAAIRESSLLVVSSDGKRVRRLNPLPSTEVRDPKLCTVLVENLPEDHSTENIQRIFGEAGNIKSICIHDPHDVGERKKRTIAEKLLLGKLHALVEYETVEAAEKSVAMLNDEQDWRYGMRVKLLKRMGKNGQKQKGWREPESEKNTNVQTSDPAGDMENHCSSEHQDDTPDEEHEENLSKEKNGHRGRNRGRARRQKYHGSSGQGHGTVSSSHSYEIPKPPPGPRMPDGTKGFTMGRGRPPTSNQS
ncbi:la-related protein 6A [Cornus florida]|uniref:la-related protein 6A n=1 Tax=Cornus florida TaxID=4283 RepID=UPI00289EDED8|nr:la-related protein 6A [Cornus florida]